AKRCANATPRLPIKASVRRGPFFRPCSGRPSGRFLGPARRGAEPLRPKSAQSSDLKPVLRLSIPLGHPNSSLLPRPGHLPANITSGEPSNEDGCGLTLAMDLLYLNCAPIAGR